MALATAVDVAAALGLDDPDQIPSDQAARLDGELARVTHAWVTAAGRDWVPGDITVQAAVLGGWVTLPDLPVEDTDVSVVDRDGNPVTVDVVDRSRLKLSRNGVRLVSGDVVNVDYTAPAVPAAVAASVAAIVARRLGVAPGSPESKFTELTTLDFRAKGAAWVAATSVLTEDEVAEARSYRPAHGVSIIARWR